MIRAQSAAATIESRLGSLTEIAAGGLVVAEIAILFGGVISRYVFDRPLVWSDELASTLFLWLAMLGAVIAFRRGEHMRMTACVDMLGGSWRAMFDSLATVAALAFLLLMAWPAYQFASDEVPITTSALQISDVWRAAALPAGIALMIVFAMLRLMRAPSAIAVCLSIGVVAVSVALFWLGTPLFHRLGNLNLLIFFVGVVAATVFAGVPIAFAFGLAIFGYLALASRGEDLSDVKRATTREIARSFVIALPAFALPFLIRAAVVEGVATATEVSTIGIVYSAVAGLVIYGRFDWGALRPMLVSTACLSGAILLIIGTATAVAWGLTQSGFSRTLAAAMTGLPGGAVTFMAASIAFVVLGSVLEGIPAIVLFGPLLFPIAKAVGIHEVHYAMVVILAMGIGLFAPPFGVGYYAACAIGRVEPVAGMRPILGYLLALVIGTIIVAAVPWISIGFLE